MNEKYNVYLNLSLIFNKADINVAFLDASAAELLRELHELGAGLVEPPANMCLILF